MSAPQAPLEPPHELRRAWLDAVVETIHREIDGLPTAGAVGSVGEAGIAIGESISLPIPEQPHPDGLSDLLRRVERGAQGALFTNGPGYLAYIPGGGIFSSAMADLLSATYNRFTGLAAAAPALCRLETDVLRWLCTQFGYDENARGLLTSGGSIANLTALMTARHNCLGDDGNYAEAVVYTSAQAHHSVARAARVCGVRVEHVRPIATDTQRRMSTAALREAVQRDRDAGRRPFCVISAAGTTNTGAIDPLREISEIAAEFGLWHHVDGAYGAAFALCDEGRRRLAGMELADSITFDPHKGLFLPYGTGCLLVRDGTKLRHAFAEDASYLQDFAREQARPDAPHSATDYGPELSRDFRGLRLWLPLVLHGAAAFRDRLADLLRLAGEAHTRLAESDAPIELLGDTQLSVIAFRLRRGADESTTDYNGRNAAFHNGINARNRVNLSSTKLQEADESLFTLRACFLSFRTLQASADAFVEDVIAEAHAHALSA